MTVLGTRPEIIRLSRLIPKLDYYCDHILVNTGQNFTPSLNSSVFKTLGLREPDHSLTEVRDLRFSDQLARLSQGVDQLLKQEKPDHLLLLGDTDSSLCSIVAKRRGIPVYHMEAGNRCHDPRSPEETNRRIIDHCSTVLMPYTKRSAENLALEGFPSSRIMVVGNPILEVIQYYQSQIHKSTILQELSLSKGNYLLATLHRAETVDDPTLLMDVIKAMQSVADTYKYPVVLSCHPRTAERISTYGIPVGSSIRVLEPLNFVDFLKLEQLAFCVLTDSGTVQEECCILGVSSVILRNYTERPETVDCGSTGLAGTDEDKILTLVAVNTNLVTPWIPPEEYMRQNVSDTVLKILLGV